MINVVLFSRPESYKIMSMDVYSNNLFENIRQSPGFNAQLLKPKDLHIPLVGKYLTMWLYYQIIAKRQNSDINHILDHSISHLIGSLDPKRTIITCYDLIGLKVPESTPFWKRNVLWGNIIRNISKARKIIAVSQCTKKDILKYTSYKSDDIAVIYGGVSAKFRQIEKSKIEGKFKFKKPAILHVGRVNFYKNVEGLIKAIALSGKEVLLVKVGPIPKRQLKLLRKLKIDFVQFMDLSEEELIQVYNAVDLLVYPSWHEGFGFPVLEAMACGCPVLCSNAGSLPEVASDAAIMVSPDDISDIAGAIERTMGSQDLKQLLREKGLKQAKKFSWEETAMETSDVYKKII